MNSVQDSESRILSKALGGLGGIGARFAARFLPNVPHESVIEVHSPVEDVRVAVAEVLKEIGQPHPDLPVGSIVCGSGHLGLNPAILSIAVEPSGAGATVAIRAVAKEGLIRQDSARKLVEKVSEALRSRLA